MFVDLHRREQRERRQMLDQPTQKKRLTCNLFLFFTHFSSTSRSSAQRKLNQVREVRSFVCPACCRSCAGSWIVHSRAGTDLSSALLTDVTSPYHTYRFTKKLKIPGTADSLSRSQLLSSWFTLCSCLHSSEFTVVSFTMAVVSLHSFVCIHGTNL